MKHTAPPGLLGGWTDGAVPPDSHGGDRMAPQSVSLFPVKQESGPALILMSAEEAREKTEIVKRQVDDIRYTLLDIQEREGWRALGYKSWAKYVTDEFGYQKSRLYQLLDAAKIERNILGNTNLSTNVDELENPNIPEGTLRPLSKLKTEDGYEFDADAQREAWKDAVESSGGKPTAKDVQNAVDQRTHNHRAQGTGENEWYTPQHYIESARSVLGTIELDPASSVTAQEKINAREFFTVDQDGLTQEWNGKVWMNPPYAQPAIRLFIEKLVSEYQASRVSEAIALTHNYTDTAWFHCAAQACTAICFTRGRIAFVDPQGNKAAPTQGQAFFYFGENISEFMDEFSQYGFVVVRHA